MHACQHADDLEVAEFLGADVHQKIFSRGIVAVDALHGILHRGGEFAVRTAELFQQHVAKARIRLVDANRVHEFLDVMVHEVTRYREVRGLRFARPDL